MEGLAIFVIRWEVRKTKPTVVEDTVRLALEMQFYLNLQGRQPDTSAESVNNLTGPLGPLSELFPNLIFNIKEELKRVVDERSGPPVGSRSDERPTSSRLQYSE